MEGRILKELKKNESSSAEPKKVGPRRDSAPCGAPGKRTSREVFICRPVDGRIVGVHLRNRRSRLDTSKTVVSDHKEADKLRRDMGKGCPIVVLLPRPKYLLRILDLPEVSEHELASMLRLEVEASLPPGFTSVEVSYRRVASDRQGYRRYEAYITREDDLAEYLAPLIDLGLEATMVLPSAVIWSTLLRQQPQAALLVAASSKSWAEIAWSQRDQTVSVRTISSTKDSSSTAELDPAIVDCVRAALAQDAGDTERAVIGWIGDDCPSCDLDGRVVCQDVGPDLFGDTNIQLNGFAGDPLLFLAGQAVLNDSDLETASSANMLPREMTALRHRRRLYRSMVAVACSCVLSLILIYVGLQVAVTRYERRINVLNDKIQVVRSEGEAVGRHLEQLKAVAAVRETRHDFYDVLRGLFDATPADKASYSHVDLDENGVLRLRGQAESLSLPFQLPERLERQPMFRNVSLRDAGQSKRGAGTITEFRIELELNRSAER